MALRIQAVTYVVYNNTDVLSNSIQWVLLISQLQIVLGHHWQQKSKVDLTTRFPGETQLFTQGPYGPFRKIQEIQAVNVLPDPGALSILRQMMVLPLICYVFWQGIETLDFASSGYEN